MNIQDEVNVSGSLPTDVVEILIRVKTFVPLYMPTQAHNEHNALALDIIKILEKYKTKDGYFAKTNN